MSKSQDQSIYSMEKLLELIEYEAAVFGWIWFTSNAMISIVDNAATQINYQDIKSVNYVSKSFKTSSWFEFTVIDRYGNEINFTMNTDQKYKFTELIDFFNNLKFRNMSLEGNSAARRRNKDRIRFGMRKAKVSDDDTLDEHIYDDIRNILNKEKSKEQVELEKIQELNCKKALFIFILVGIGVGIAYFLNLN